MATEAAVATSTTAAPMGARLLLPTQTIQTTQTVLQAILGPPPRRAGEEQEMEPQYQQREAGDLPSSSHTRSSHS